MKWRLIVCWKKIQILLNLSSIWSVAEIVFSGHAQKKKVIIQKLSDNINYVVEINGIFVRFFLVWWTSSHRGHRLSFAVRWSRLRRQTSKKESIVETSGIKLASSERLFGFFFSLKFEIGSNQFWRDGKKMVCVCLCVCMCFASLNAYRCLLLISMTNDTQVVKQSDWSL